MLVRSSNLIGWLSFCLRSGNHNAFFSVVILIIVSGVVRFCLSMVSKSYSTNFTKATLVWSGVLSQQLAERGKWKTWSGVRAGD